MWGDSESTYKLLTNIDDVAGNGTNGESLLLCSGEVLLLANVGHDADYIIALLNEPLENARGVKT